VMWVMWNVVLVRLETELASVQERCTVCTERSKAQKSFWTHPMELIGYVGHVESCFGPFEDGVSVRAKVFSNVPQGQIILDAPNGTPG
jgi:hypothetical protein